MKATRTTTTTMKRSCCTFLFLTIVVSAGCTTTDNNVGSLGNDSAVAGGSGQDARDGKPASACTADSDCPVGLSCGYAVADGCAAKGVCIQSNFQGAVGPDYMCGCDGRGILPVLIQDSGSSSTVLYVSAPYSGWAGPCVGLPDAAVFDSAGMGKDVGPESISADAGRVCLYPAGADTSVEVGNGSFVGCRPGLTQDLCDPSSYQMTCQASGLTPASIPQPASTLNCKAVPVPTPSNTLFYCCPCADSPLPDAAVPDAAGVGKDAAQDAPEAGATHRCQANGATCTAITPNTACTPFTGRLYDDKAGCYSTVDTTLGCCATATGEFCALPAASGCYQSATVSTIAYWTPNLAGAGVTLIPGGGPCDQTEYAKVASAPPCAANPPDAAALPDAPTSDAHTPVTLPLCTTDSDCCVSVDECMATATLTGNRGYGPVPGTHATCLPCMVPAIQVQCQGGFCVGTRLINFYDSSSPLLHSHCGAIALPDAGAAHAASPHAAVDAGQSYQTFWTCGGP
jgi:hypothetical protein